MCARPADSCPAGALDRGDRCYLVSSRPAPWWDAAVACHNTDPRGQVANLGLQDWQLTMAVTGRTTALSISTETIGSCALRIG